MQPQLTFVIFLLLKPQIAKLQSGSPEFLKTQGYGDNLWVNSLLSMYEDLS